MASNYQIKIKHHNCCVKKLLQVGCSQFVLAFRDRPEISNIVGVCVPLDQFHLYLDEVRALGVVQERPRDLFALLAVDAKLIPGDWIRTERQVLVAGQPVITLEDQL